MTLWTVACQALLYMEFPRQEYWNGLPFPSPGDLPDSGIELQFSALQADSLLSEPSGKLLDGVLFYNFLEVYTLCWDSQVALAVKNLPANARDMRDTGSTPGSGRSPRGGHGNPLQYFCLENPVDRGA